MRADISAIMNFLGVTDKKHKSHNDMNKHGEAQASLANIKNSERSAQALLRPSSSRGATLIEKTLRRQIPTIKVKWSMQCLPDLNLIS